MKEIQNRDSVSQPPLIRDVSVTRTWTQFLGWPQYLKGGEKVGNATQILILEKEEAFRHYCCHCLQIQRLRDDNLQFFSTDRILLLFQNGIAYYYRFNVCLYHGLFSMQLLSFLMGEGGIKRNLGDVRIRIYPPT